MALDIYQAITDRILELLDQGTVPWRKPFSSGNGGFPKNLISGNDYRGINVFLLAVTAMLEGYDSPYWLTFKQAKARDAHVRKGEKGSLVIFWKQYATEDKKTGDPIKVPVMRQYKVFNAEQCEGLELPSAPEPVSEPVPFEPIYQAMSIVDGYEDAPLIEHQGNQALYKPANDLVRMPDPREFISTESYYATLFHELVHSTGHSTRLDRGIDTKVAAFGSPDYSREELVAEMGSAFLAAAAGISPPTIEQSAAYIESWRKKLRGDKKLVVQAAGAGQRAADWILGVG
ncbi:MAG: DUF1738 domain-containing protein [Phycisphaerales bacterium]|nr:DUF1738 domain-containing protein [Phycisphaerales bacterium]